MKTKTTIKFLCLSVALCCFLLSKNSFAQTVYSIPSTTCSSCLNGAYGPVDICDGRYTAEADIFPSSSLTFGTITKIAYDQISGAASNVPIKMYMTTTSATAFSTASSWSTAISGATLVFSGNVSFTSAGWNTITLSTPYGYSSNNLEILIETDWATATNCSTNPIFYYYTASGNSDEFWEGGANSSSALQSETGVVDDEPAPVQVTVTACTNPTITAQPSSASQNLCQGNTGTALSVTATGSSLTYQWYSNTTASNTGGTSISGATSNSYTPSTATVGSLYYYCSVNSIGCNTTSAVSGSVVISAPPSITSQSTGTQTLCQGITATAMTVTATGSSLTYQWYSNTAASTSGGTLISGATSASYTPSTAIAGTLYYYCIVKGASSCSTATSAVSGAIVINAAPATPTGTTPQVFCSNSNPTIASLTATGTSIQWYAAASGGTALASTTALTNGTVYYVTQAVSGCQSISRLAVTATVNVAPSISSQITGTQALCQGSTAATMSVTATGTSLTYQWYSNTAASNSGGTLISGATSSTYIPSTTNAGIVYYYCVVNGLTPCASVTSTVSGAVEAYLCSITGITAGGDLSGTYPDPTVAKINGNTVPANSVGYLENDGSGNLSWTPISADVSGSGTANNMPVWTSSNQLGNSPVNVSGGNVGIGTTNPTSLLDVNGAGLSTYSKVISLENNTGQNILSADNEYGDPIFFGNPTTGQMLFQGGLLSLNGFIQNTNAASLGILQSGYIRPINIMDATETNTLFTISYTGNVGIGTASPAQALDVAGNANVSGTLHVEQLSVDSINPHDSVLVIGDPLKISMHPHAKSPNTNFSGYTTYSFTGATGSDCQAAFGIGTQTPDATLTVAGSLPSSSNLQFSILNTTGGCIYNTPDVFTIDNNGNTTVTGGSVNVNGTGNYYLNGVPLSTVIASSDPWQVNGNTINYPPLPVSYVGKAGINVQGTPFTALQMYNNGAATYFDWVQGGISGLGLGEDKYMGYNLYRDNTGMWQTAPGAKADGGSIIVGDINGNILFSTVKGNLGGHGQSVSDATIVQNTGLCVQAGGGVGIGTLTPVGPLQVSGTNGWGGLIVSAENIDPGNYALSHYNLANSGMLLLGWNYSRGGGENDFISNRSGGSTGGFNFYDYTNSNQTNLLVSMLGNGNVGIGTGNPLATLDIEGPAGTTVGLIVGQGNVGIGTTTPVSPLTVATGSGQWANAITVLPTTYSGSQQASILLGGWSIEQDFNGNSTQDLLFNNPNTITNPNTNSVVSKPLYIAANGDIGINNTQPQYLLDVWGTIKALEVKVCPGTCDFVFEDTYKLMPLDTLNKFLKANHHLPGIASAKEMEAAGSISLGEMDKNLLQKVEELTLYTIAQDKKAKEQQDEIKEQDEKIKELEAKLEELMNLVKK